MSGLRSFFYKAVSDRILAQQAHPAKGSVRGDVADWFEVCVVTKNETDSWAAYLAERLNLIDELRGGGLSNDDIRALARLTTNYTPTNDKEPTAN